MREKRSRMKTKTAKNKVRENKRSTKDEELEKSGREERQRPE